MSISSISSSSNYSYSTTSSTTTDTSSLEKQKETLNQEIQTELSSKDDEKTKSAKVAALQAQVQAVEAEIQAEKSNKTSDVTNKQVQPPKNDDSKNSINSEKSKQESNNIIDVYA